MPAAAASSSAALVPTDDSPSLADGKIQRIDVQDFKSYGGSRTIGPFGEFTAVIGPNGAGKKNEVFFWRLSDR